MKDKINKLDTYKKVFNSKYFIKNTSIIMIYYISNMINYIYNIIYYIIKSYKIFK